MYILLFSIYTVISIQLPSIHQNVTYFYYTPGYILHYCILILGLNAFLTYHCFHLSTTNKQRIFTFITSFTMLLGSFIPYHLDTADLVSTLHVIITILSNIFLFYLLYSFISTYKFTNFILYRELCQITLYCISIISMFLIMFGSINIIVELSLLASILVIIYKLQKLK